MNARFITYVIIGVAFGCTQLWFVYWVVKLFKEKQRVMAARRAGGTSETRKNVRRPPRPPDEHR